MTTQQKLLEKCMAMLQSYKPTVETADTHVYNHLGVDFDKDPDKLFAQQVFYGCIRMEKCLSMFLNALYHVNASSLIRPDYTLFKVLAYLAIFRLDELGVARFLAFIKSQEVSKMYRFLDFLFDEHQMDEWVKEMWCKLLDRGYVEGTLLAGLSRHREGITRWLRDHREAAFGASAAPEPDNALAATAKGHTKSLTIPVGPNITAPRPKKIPMPIQIDQTIRANPLPDYLDDVSLDDLIKKASERKRATIEATRSKYRPEDAFKLHASKSIASDLRQEKEAKEQAELTKKFTAKPPPNFSTTPANIKLNAAAVLREEYLFRLRQESDAAEIAAYEASRHDKAEYYEKIEKAKEEEAKKRAEAIAMRKQNMRQAASRAATARDRDFQKKREGALRLQEESAAILEEKRLALEEEIRTRRDVVEAVNTMTAVAPKIARQLLTGQNKDMARAVKDSRIEAEQQREEERTSELRHRNDLIREIRALERVPSIKFKAVDPTSESGLRLLDEMSLVELRERLAINKAREEEELEKKKQAIIRTKAERADAMIEKVALISQQRNIAACLNAEARRTRQQMEAEQAARARIEREHAAVALLEKLEQKRLGRIAEQERLEAERRQIQQRNLFLGAEKSAIEERRIASVVRAQERKAADATHAILKAQASATAIAEAEERAAAKRLADAEHALRLAEHAKRLAISDAIRENKEMELEEIACRKEAFIAATEWRSALFDLRDERDPFTASIRAKEQTEAREKRGGMSVDDERRRAISARVSRLPADNPLHASLSMRLSRRIGATGVIS